MSKSLGNMIEPEAIIQQSGAEVLRLWVAMVDYREEIRIGKEILARVVEAYRKIRNTLRILTANLFDFDPQCDQVAVADLKDVDRYAVARFGECTERVLSHYDRYEFPAISHALSDFLTVDVSAFYVDVSKDCLYTYAARSPERRSAQTAIYLIADGLARLFAPLLPVTADELWHHLPGDRDESVHLAEFPTELSALADRELIARWRRLLAIRDAVNIEVEQRRQEKTVGTSLEARVSLLASGATAALLEGCRDELPTLFITSAVNLVIDETVQAGDAATSGSIWSEPDGALAIEVDRVGGHKCERCWRYVPSLSQESGREGLCARCVDVLSEAVGVDR